MTGGEAVTTGEGSGAGPVRAAVFDVDGTLVDTNYLHAVAWWEACAQAGHQVPMAAVHQSIGLAGQALLERLLGADTAAAEGSGIKAAHATLYGTWRDRLPAFDGAAALLRTLAGRGWRVVLATSAQGPELAALRRALDADDALWGTTNADEVSEGKPAPEPVRAALELAGAPPERAVFVGDSVWDVQAASRAGVPCIALLSGGICREALLGAGAVAVHRDVGALLAALDDSLLGG